MKVDLHIHTIASDGSWTPTELIEQIQLAGIGLFAVTDHDCVAVLAATAALAREAGLMFIPGVEICSTVQGQCFHILGYGIDAGAPGLLKLLKHNIVMMEQADEDSIRKLIAQGLPINYAEYMAYQHDPERGGWKSLNYLVDRGLCADVKGFFNELFTVKRGIVFPEFPPPSEIIAAIHAAGGKAMLAHPGSAFHGTQLEETFEYFAGEAIDGVECYHPSHDEETTAQAIAWCERRSLLVTGGSDCHGAFVPSRRLGTPAIQRTMLRLGSLVD